MVWIGPYRDSEADAAEGKDMRTVSSLSPMQKVGPTSVSASPIVSSAVRVIPMLLLLSQEDSKPVVLDKVR
jgi:hypothetical protein